MFVRLRAIGARLSRLREWFPLTNLGVVVSFLAAIAYWGFGVPRVDYVVQLVAALAMVLVVTALLAVFVGSVLVYRATRHLAAEAEPTSFEAQRGFAEVFSLPTWWSIPVFDVTWTWLRPVGFQVQTVRAGGRRVERVETARRGRIDEIVRRLVIEDGFGLARVVLHRTEDRTVTVVPYTGALDRAPLLRSLAAGDALPHPRGQAVGDPVDMRRYVPGDPLKLAMWKVYARTRQLMVRTPERAIAPSTQVVAYLPSAEADEPAAAAARLAVETGLLGPDWLFGADGAPTAAQDIATARRAISESRRHRNMPAGQAAGLEAFIATASTSETVRLIVFVPGRPGPWLDRVVEAVRPRADRTTCVVVVDGVRSDEDTNDPRWSRWLKRPEPLKDEDEAIVTPEELNEVVITLGQAGVEVSALDRIQGRALNVGRLPARQVA